MDLTCRKQTNSLCFFITTYFLLATTSHATTDTMSQTQSLKDNQTLISAGQSFQLGFFSPGNSTNRYVGIWYYNISPLTVVWVANRDNPIKNSSSSRGVLTFGSNNNLVVLDGDNLLWSSSNASVSSKSTHIRLLDSGNLVVESSENTVLWQSFDNPSDTFLPGMKVGLDLRTGVNQFFNSWTSEDDPSTGKFSLGISSDRSPQIVIREGHNLHWRTGQWDGQLFTGIANMRPMYLYGFRLSDIEQEHKIYFDYTPINESVFVRFRLSWSGLDEFYYWDTVNAKWETAWAQPISDCEVYNKCGDYGTCRETDAPICTCLQGFVAKDLEGWGKGNWSSGCVRRTPLECERGGRGGDDGFLKLEGVKYPDSWEWMANVVDEGGCRGECMKNCSCKAYAYVAGVGCVVWANDLVDIHHFPHGGNELFLRLARSEFHDKKSHKVSWVIILIVILVVSPLKIILCVYHVGKCWKKKKGDGTEGSCPDLPLFNLAAIEVATRNFSNSNKLGQGGFGPVYKGKMNDGREVAVKRLSKNSGQGVEEFKNEVVLIAKLQHRNLVRLLGCCIEGQEKILIYEYMPNRSLDSFLCDPTKQVLLNWGTRFSIIEGIARGLLYLHRDSRLRIVHRDLKVSNILLDEEMNPKISDFGMARIFGGNDNNQENTKRVMGTYGYMSPEYAMDGLFSMKSDVYSFGVLLLEILSGQKNNSFHHHQTSKSLLGYAWLLWSEDRVIEFVDPLIRNSCSTCEVLKCIHIGLLCVQDRPDDRPTMPSLVHMLASEAAPDAIPKQPTFTTEKCLNGREKSEDNMRSSSGNQITLSVMVGR